MVGKIGDVAASFITGFSDVDVPLDSLLASALEGVTVLAAVAAATAVVLLDLEESTCFGQVGVGIGAVALAAGAGVVVVADDAEAGAEVEVEAGGRLVAGEEVAAVAVVVVVVTVEEVAGVETGGVTVEAALVDAAGVLALVALVAEDGAATVPVRVDGVGVACADAEDAGAAVFSFLC